MTPKELRIGNYFDKISRKNEVHIPMGAELIVFTLGFFGVEYHRFGENPFQMKNLHSIEYCDMSPIPLTNNWLLRFGLKKHNNGWIIKAPKEWPNMFGLYEYPNGEHKFVAMEIQQEVKYVHQFQNLYFALTGIELELI